MGKLLPLPYPGQSMDEYREQLVNFKKNYWGFLKSSKGGGKFIPSPPLTLIKKTKKMTRKLNEHLEEELFNKEKRATPKVDKDKVIKTTPKLVKESVFGIAEDKPVKKKKPYYRKRYKKPTPVVVIPEPVKNKNYFAQGFIIGLVIGIVLTKLYLTFN
jgi:hypothetical protein